MSDRIRHSIGMHLNKEEVEIMKRQLKELKRKFGYSRNDVLKVVCMKLLSEDEFIDFVQINGNLKKKEIRSRKRKIY